MLDSIPRFHIWADDPSIHQQILDGEVGSRLTFAQAGGLPNGSPSREIAGPHGERLFLFPIVVFVLKPDLQARILLGGGTAKALEPGRSEFQSGVAAVALEIGSLNLTIKDGFEGVD